MKIAVGCDHRGYLQKNALVLSLAAAGHEIVDCGCGGPESCDYPDPAFAVGEEVAAGRCDRGVLICGSGIGVSIAANKVRGVRAALCCDLDSARMTRRHNDSNVICFSGDRSSADEVRAMVEVWLAEEFEGGRHARRVDKIKAYESNH